ncbi:unnamed protein product [Durusdinium trenchii]|uniref:DUF7869 domain-containing protein n=1 Tax=Durusdinium trenchii TaxID=1381693 RepID=A0ABP0PL35_9DINO
MDQAKLRVPRWGYKRISKAMEKVFRPALHLVGTYTHGYKLQLSLADEDQKKNSETSIELVCTALCSVLQSVGTVPLMVHLQQDNTYREGKNTFMLTFMMLLQVLCCVRITTLGFLRTAHSHDDIDQCFGQISRLLMGKTCSSADGMISILQDCIMSNAPNENSASGRIRGSVAEASKLDEVSLWKDFVGQVGIKFKGLRHIHYFRFCHRRDLGPEVLDNVLNLEEFGRGFEPNPTDTFLVTKRWLADHTVLRAICVVPESMAKDIRTGFTLPRGTAPRRSISETPVVARLAEMESPRYDLIRQKLEGLGYVISGELYNTADYGLPQQRRRAWLLCIIKAELATSEEQLANDMRLFMRRNAKLKKRIQEIQPFATTCSARELAILAVAVEELALDHKVDAMKELTVIQDQNFQRSNFPKSDIFSISCLIPGGKYIINTIIEDSMTFSKKLGLIDSDATAEKFMDKFLTMKDWAAARPLGLGFLLKLFVLTLNMNTTRQSYVLKMAPASDMTSAMIKRIIRQNVDSKKLAVSSYEWSEILAAMQKEGEAVSVQTAMDMYNANPEVTAHGGSSAKDSEASIPIDWSLPMSSLSQEMIFCRIRTNFERSTAIIQNPSDRKKYRQTEEELMSLRNLLCLWASVRDFCSTRLKDFHEFDKLIRTSTAKDIELREILESRPAVFAVSMLPSAQRQALEEARMQEEGISLDVEKERLKVRDARWTYFQSALERDQKLLMCVKEAPQKVEALRHRKAVAWRLQQAQLGEKVVNAYQDKFLRCDLVNKVELAQQKINEFRSFVVALNGELTFCGCAQSAGCSELDVYYITVVDLNVPGAKSSERVQELCSCLQFSNDLCPQRHVGLVELPEYAKKASKRGLADEEQELQNTLWSLRQTCDSRWICPFDIHPSADAQTNRRRFSTGRLVCNMDGAEDNIFLTSSELGTAGRPLSHECITLPLSREIIVPESLSPDGDLKQAERVRPSVETCSAQKGTKRWMQLLQSLLTMGGGSPLKGKPVVVLNLTGYIEDAFEMRLQEMELKGGFRTNNLYYQSVWWINKENFGHARLSREITDAWISRRFSHGGHQFSAEAPDLSQAELDAIPGATSTHLDSMKFEVLERTGPGNAFSIKVDEHKFWSQQSGEIGEKYNELRGRHLELIGRSRADESSPGEELPSTAVDSEVTPQDPSSVQCTELDSLSKLEASVGIDFKCASEVSNIELILAKDSSLWILASQDKNIPKFTLLGGFGTGQWVAQSDSQPGIDFAMPDGDKTIIQVDEASFSSEAQGVSTCSLFKLLVRSEREKGSVDHRMSFLDISRKDDAAVDPGSDGFNIGIKTAMKFRCMRDPRSSSGEDRVTAKNLFSKCLAAASNSDLITKVFRFRYERVGQNWKIQRPYVISSKGFSVKKDKPLKLTKA